MLLYPSLPLPCLNERLDWMVFKPLVAFVCCDDCRIANRYICRWINLVLNLTWTCWCSLHSCTDECVCVRACVRACVRVCRCAGGTNYHLRGHDTLHIPRVNSTTYGLHSSAYLGAKVWNCLPQTIKGAVTLSTFKALIQSWYGETCKCAYCRVY